MEATSVEQGTIVKNNIIHPDPDEGNELDELIDK